MSRGLVAVVAVVLVTSLVTVAGGAAAPEGLTVSSTQQEFDRVEFHITVSDDGSAQWTFRYGTELANQSEIDQFETYADRFENESTPLYEDFRSQAGDLAARGSNVTGREMAARDFSKRAYTRGLGPSNRLGVVEMSFTWTGFAEVDGDRVVVGDVFDDGLYIGSGQRLIVEPSDGLAVESVDPEPDDRPNDGVAWRGDHEFADERPHVVFSSPSTGVATTPAATTDPEPTTTPTTSTTDRAGVDPETQQTIPWLVITAVAALVVIGAVMAWQRVGDRFGGASDGDDGGGPPPDADPEPAVPDEEMLTDEERVLGLLRENGGRMRQVNIVEETGWSKSKVSMLLSDMEDEGQVTKLRVGRENIVSLPGREPNASGSPYEGDDE